MGIEATASQAESASEGHGFDEVLHGYFPDALAGRSDRFDLITFNDVLEHIIDPWSVVDGLHERLTPGGRVVATIPNVQYIFNLARLLAGRWDYEDDGILDRTHVRFFTRATCVSLFAERGFIVEQCEGVNPAPSLGSLSKRAMRAGLQRLVPDSRYLHFVVVARTERSRAG